MTTIPADRIAIDGDKAWWIVNEDGWQLAETYDRPCDTCEGNQRWIDFDRSGQLIECGDCDGTGRHTFKIEVECEHKNAHAPTPELAASGYWVCWDCGVDDGGGGTDEYTGTYPLTVSVVPGMVLPIHDYCPDPSIDDHRSTFIGDGILSAAKPGDWAVQLLIHKGNQ